MGERRAVTVVFESHAPIELMSGDKRERRAALLAVAIGEGLGLREAMEDAATAELWLTGALGSARVLGLETGFGRIPDEFGSLPGMRPWTEPEPVEPPADTAVEAEAEAPAHPEADAESSAEPVATVDTPEPPADTADRVLAAIEALGPEVSNSEIAQAVGVSTVTVSKYLRLLKEAGRIRTEGTTSVRRIHVGAAAAEAVPEPESKAAPVDVAGQAEPAEPAHAIQASAEPVRAIEAPAEPAGPPVRRFEPGTMENLVFGILKENGHEVGRAHPSAAARGWWKFDGKVKQWKALVAKADEYRAVAGLTPIGRPE